MQFADLDLNKVYTYADYLKWTFEERMELIMGKIFKMSPAPNMNHQRVSMRISSSIFHHLKGKKCEVFSAPSDVRFPGKSKDDKEIITVLQPDIFVVCDPTKIEPRGCLGAPDLVIEILSPGNNKKELKYKHQIYEESGVQEYWIVDNNERSVLIYKLTEGRLLASHPLYPEDTIITDLFPGLKINLAEVFEGI